MTDKYDTHWLIVSLDRQHVLRYKKVPYIDIVMEDIDSCSDPLKLNTARDCELFLRSIGYYQDNFDFIEIAGGK
jgi:hypothetical protein